MREIKCGNIEIGYEKPTFIIAEIGLNHNGKLDLGETLIKKAVQSGANAVKFQTYITEKRVPKDSPIYKILKDCELSYDDQKKLKRIASDEGVVFFSTPFDKESVDFLESIEVPIYKIASFDIVNLELIKNVAQKKKPIIISRGMASSGEIDKMLEVVNNESVACAILHCVSAYPTPEDQANLKLIRDLIDNYDIPIGYSDHTLGVDVPIFAVATGACIIEKHFTLDRNTEGPDHSLSADPETLKKMIDGIRNLEKILGDRGIRTLDVEKPILEYRRPTSLS